MRIGSAIEAARTESSILQAISTLQTSAALNPWGSVTGLRPEKRVGVENDYKGHLSSNNLAFDGTGNLYVGTAYTFPGFFEGSITVYPPYGASRYRRIAAGIVFPVAMAFDDANNLYVDNYGCPSQGQCGSITVYARGRKTLPTDNSLRPGKLRATA